MSHVTGFKLIIKKHCKSSKKMADSTAQGPIVAVLFMRAEDYIETSLMLQYNKH